MDIQHVEFDEDTALAMGSPVTEVAALVPKPDINEKEARNLLTKLRVNLNAEKSCHGVTIGESREQGDYCRALGVGQYTGPQRFREQGFDPGYS
ncbi:hypothetical protein C0993_002907 [Termitomyces sp. T159_Od127]|nr:hypothetical protein C0993_002907 [Termitomyces sp. T159_Od127]